MVSEEVTTCAKTHSLPTPDTGALLHMQDRVSDQHRALTPCKICWAPSRCPPTAWLLDAAGLKHLQFQHPDNFVLPETDQGNTEAPGDKHAGAQPEEATP